MFSDVLQQQLMESMGIGRRYDVDQVVGYKPENSWNAELGALIKTADKQFSASVTAFYIHCRDQQLTVFPEGDITGRIMTNAGKARSAGIEVSVAYSPVERLTLNAAYGYTNAKFLEFNNGKEDYSGRSCPTLRKTPFCRCKLSYPRAVRTAALHFDGTVDTGHRQNLLERRQLYGTEPILQARRERQTYLQQVFRGFMGKKHHRHAVFHVLLRFHSARVPATRQTRAVWSYSESEYLRT